jgi:hypothetical protein
MAKATKTGKKNAPKKAGAKEQNRKKPIPVSPLASKEVIEAHIAKKQITDQVKDVLKKNNVHKLGLTLQSIQLAKADDESGYHCTKSFDKVISSGGKTCVVSICVAWSDGKDHSSDNPTSC